MQAVQLGKYLTLEDFCTHPILIGGMLMIDSSPQNPDATIPALKALNQFILEPVIDCFGSDRFQLTYGFCLQT